MADRMLNVKDVRQLLGLSAFEVLNLVKSGRLRSYRYVGNGPVSRSEVGEQTGGLRFRESDVEQMLEASLVK